MNNKKISNLLDLRQKETFRVAFGRILIKKGKPTTVYSKWVNFNIPFPSNPTIDSINLREVLDSEIVIEFDDTIFKGTKNEFINQVSIPAMLATLLNLKKDSIPFKLFDHGGKSPHLHIHNLPISHLAKEDLKLFKETFIKYYVPIEFHQYADFSLCGIHMIAIEYEKHWKGCYGVKELVFESNKKEPNFNEALNKIEQYLKAELLLNIIEK